MKQAISAGGIFVKKQNNKYYLLLLRYPEFGDLGFLKGHLEQGETIEQTALREINEEAGLENVKIVRKIGEFTRPSPKDSEGPAIKTIHLFLMQTDNFNHKPSEKEYGWFEYDEATKKMAYKEDAEFLRQYKKDIISSFTF